MHGYQGQACRQHQPDAAGRAGDIRDQSAGRARHCIRRAHADDGIAAVADAQQRAPARVRRPRDGFRAARSGAGRGRAGDGDGGDRHAIAADRGRNRGDPRDRRARRRRVRRRAAEHACVDERRRRPAPAEQPDARHRKRADRACPGTERGVAERDRQGNRPTRQPGRGGRDRRAGGRHRIQPGDSCAGPGPRGRQGHHRPDRQDRRCADPLPARAAAGAAEDRRRRRARCAGDRRGEWRCRCSPRRRDDARACRDGHPRRRRRPRRAARQGIRGAGRRGPLSGQAGRRLEVAPVAGHEAGGDRRSVCDAHPQGTPASRRSDRFPAAGRADQVPVGARRRRH